MYIFLYKIHGTVIIIFISKNGRKPCSDTFWKEEAVRHIHTDRLRLQWQNFLSLTSTWEESNKLSANSFTNFIELISAPLDLDLSWVGPSLELGPSRFSPV